MCERAILRDPPQPKLEIILGHDIIPRSKASDEGLPEGSFKGLQSAGRGNREIAGIAVHPLPIWRHGLADASTKNDVQTPLPVPHGGSAFILPYTTTTLSGPVNHKRAGSDQGHVRSNTIHFGCNSRRKPLKRRSTFQGELIMPEDNNVGSVELATELTIAWLGNPNVRATADEVPSFLRQMHATI